jgi:MFS family permease
MSRQRSSVVAGAAVTLVATLISIYIVSQFLRNSVGVIAPNLAGDLGLSPADLGLLSSVFFFTFAAVQIPLGMALDRFGPRLCLLVGAAVTVVGALVFAVAPNAGVLILGRGLLGLGTAGALVGPLAIYARRFAPDRFATLTGLHIGLGTVGTLVATAPLAFSAAQIGWRNSFVVVAAFTALIGLLLAAVVRDGGPPASDRGENWRMAWRESVSGMVAVTRTPSVGRLFAMHLVLYSPFALVVGLWGGPYLAHVYGYSLEDRGSMLLIPAVGQIVGLIAWGPMDRVLGSHKLPVLIGAGGTAAALGWLAAVGAPSAPVLMLWLAVFGFVSAFGPVLIAHGKALFVPHQVGRGLTLLNMGSMGGAFLVQAVSGFVIDWFPATAQGGYALSAYRLVFTLQAGFIVLMCLAYWGSRDPMQGPSAKRGAGALPGR